MWSGTRGADMPTLTGIDHIHVYVDDRAAAQQWYRDVLGFTPVEAFLFWATPDGPLTLENPEGTVHLALFESRKFPHTSAIAFGASGEQFLAWKAHLEGLGIELRLADHDAAWSLYFSDPFDNLHEITTYEHDFVRRHISAPGAG